jgi:hypothetical protein
MREWYRDAMLALAVLFGGLQAYLVWRGPQSADPPAMQAAASHPIAGLILVAVIFLIAGLLNAAPLINRFLPTGSEERLSDQLPLVAAAPTTEKTWGDEMAEEDTQKLQERVREFNQRKEFHYDLGSDPYLEIITEVWNGSVFQLVNYGEITGHVVYNGRQLATEPRIIVSAEPPLLSLTHGGFVTLTVRQYLSSEVADTMEANRNRGVAIDFESVAVTFKILPAFRILPATKVATYKWRGPRFAIEDVRRI